MFRNLRNIAVAVLFALATGPAFADDEFDDDQLPGIINNLKEDLGNLVEQIALINARIDALESALTTAQGDIAALQGDPVLALSDFVSDLAAFVVVDEVPTDLDGNGMIDMTSELLPRILFEGVNVQVVNGHVLQTTRSLNGLGNLIVGYNEPRASGFVCSGGAHDNQAACLAANQVYARNHKSGSHNLVVGPGNAYSRTGGAVFGERNVINSVGASVTGGEDNIARGPFSSVSGGARNTARGMGSSVSGGSNGTAGGLLSSVSAGSRNTAGGQFSSVSGGSQNAAGGTFSNVSAGAFNTASGQLSGVSGGENNAASGKLSSVSGGSLRTAPGGDNWAAGALFEPN